MPCLLHHHGRQKLLLLQQTLTMDTASQVSFHSSPNLRATISALNLPSFSAPELSGEKFMQESEDM
jgi:hypothetical protein